jgi:hypothetical protein
MILTLRSPTMASTEQARRGAETHRAILERACETRELEAALVPFSVYGFLIGGIAKWEVV